MFAASGGRIKPPKHVSIALAVKSLTGSLKLIKMLNGFGHSVSECETGEVETEIALHSLAEQVFIPSIIRYPSECHVSVAFDNMAINEILTGSNTAHVTNRKAVQQRVQWCAPPSVLPEERTEKPKPCQ